MSSKMVYTPDPGVLRDAARLLHTAARKLLKIADYIEMQALEGEELKKVMAEARATLNAAQARIQ